MKYAVRVVQDSDLPQDVKRVIVERHDGTPLLLLAESVAQSWRLMRAWEDMCGEAVSPAVLRAV